MDRKTWPMVDGTTNNSCEKLNCLRLEEKRYIKEKIYIHADRNRRNLCSVITYIEIME